MERHECELQTPDPAGFAPQTPDTLALEEKIRTLKREEAMREVFVAISVVGGATIMCVATVSGSFLLVIAGGVVLVGGSIFWSSRAIEAGKEREIYTTRLRQSYLTHQTESS